jgi:hypothetical protein
MIPAASLGREVGTQAEADRGQRREAIKRRGVGEPVREIALLPLMETITCNTAYDPTDPGNHIECNTLTCFFRNKGPFAPNRVSGIMEPTQACAKRRTRKSEPLFRKRCAVPFTTARPRALTPKR